MTEVTDDWIVADSEDEDTSRPVEIADQSGPLSGNPFSTGPEKILQRQEIFKLYVLYRMLTEHNFASLTHLLPAQRGCQPLDISNASLHLPEGAKILTHQMLLCYSLEARKH